MSPTPRICTKFSLAACILSAACTPPDPNDRFIGVETIIANDESAAAERFIDAISNAQETLYVALPAGDNTDISDALVSAYERGVVVEVISDFDLATSPVISALSDADIPIRLADAGITYFEFNLGEDTSWGSDLTIMSHAYVVADGVRLVAANRVGSSLTGDRVVFDIHGEDVIQDLLWEHNQVMGGTDATAVDAYDAPSKSILETRWRYSTSTDVTLEMWFGPQERLLKRVIDAVYSARSAAWILTDDFANEGLANALQDKARWGFDVEVVVGPHFKEASSELSNILEDETPDVPKFQVTDVEEIPTIVLIDYPADSEGYRPYTRAMVITHDLFSASRLYRGRTVTTDQLIDGTMWVLSDTDEPGAEIVALEKLYRDHRDRAGEMP